MMEPRYKCSDCKFGVKAHQSRIDPQYMGIPYFCCAIRSADPDELVIGCQNLAIIRNAMDSI